MKSEMEDMIVAAAFLDFLETSDSLPQGVTMAEAFDKVQDIDVQPTDREHTAWSCEVGGGHSGPLQGFRAKGTVRFVNGALEEELRAITGLSDQVSIPAGTIVTITSVSTKS